VQELHAAMKAEAIPLGERLSSHTASVLRKAPCGWHTCAITSRHWTSSRPIRSGSTARCVAIRHRRGTGMVPGATTNASLARHRGPCAPTRTSFYGPLHEPPHTFLCSPVLRTEASPWRQRLSTLNGQASRNDVLGS
jgi:hypothetical protein